MQILQYTELRTHGYKEKIKKTTQHLVSGNFRAADAKKLSSKGLYRAKLDDKARLIFCYGEYQKKKVLCLLEVLPNHEYDRSRFLRDLRFDEEKLKVIHEPEKPSQIFPQLSQKTKSFRFLNKAIVFDDVQEEVFEAKFPLIVVGSAGSGKTALTLEKLKQFSGNILYVTHSNFLVENSRDLYYSYGYRNDKQTVDFLSYIDLLESFARLSGSEVTFNNFDHWFQRHKQQYQFTNSHQLFEEFKGVLTSSWSSPYLKRDEYITLGIKQSIVSPAERARTFDLFEKYLEFLKEKNLYDLNITSYDYLSKVKPVYDALVVDEVQDFTPIQLFLILKTLSNAGNFVLCGDSNQIVHPNFFSWSGLKSLFYKEHEELLNQKNLLHILKRNYRNSTQVTDLANKILKIKHARFGSVDRESNHLVEATHNHSGSVDFVPLKEKKLAKLNASTRRSTNYAVLVLRDEEKELARRFFSTPLLFSVREAKGVEYENVILFSLIGSAAKEFTDIASGIEPSDLLLESLIYSRAKDKSDKSLEIYKFFINALYVATTRSVSNLIIVEPNSKHPLLSLLNVQETEKEITIKEQASSEAEWQQEAHRLKKQGKKEQAESIESMFLKKDSTPWTEMSKDTLKELIDKAYSKKKYDKRSQRLVLGYGLSYRDFNVHKPLVEAKFSLAGDLENAPGFMNKRFCPELLKEDSPELHRNLTRYGLEYRSPLARTPLAEATYLGQIKNVESLIKKGANITCTDLRNHIPVEIALRESFIKEGYAAEVLPSIFHLLSPNGLRIRTKERLLKLDPTIMEYFLVLAMIAWIPIKLTGRERKQMYFEPFIRATELHSLFENLPDSVLPRFRKKKSYINAILAKNEKSKDSRYNRELFQRIATGKYLVNPNLEIYRNETWYKIYDLLALSFLKMTSRDSYNLEMIETLNRFALNPDDFRLAQKGYRWV